MEDREKPGSALQKLKVISFQRLSCQGSLTRRTLDLAVAVGKKSRSTMWKTVGGKVTSCVSLTGVLLLHKTMTDHFNLALGQVLDGYCIGSQPEERA